MMETNNQLIIPTHVNPNFFKREHALKMMTALKPKMPANWKEVFIEKLPKHNTVFGASQLKSVFSLRLKNYELVKELYSVFAPEEWQEAVTVHELNETENQVETTH